MTAHTNLAFDESSVQKESGFRHFLRSPNAHEAFRVHGRPLLDAEDSRALLRSLMRKLSFRMDAEIAWPSHRDPSLKPWENPNLPSGYTYLGQLVSHDLVQSSIPASALGVWRPEIENARDKGLNLDTIYGRGPVACPHLYEPEAERRDSRSRLKLGRVQRDDRRTDPTCPLRDIPREKAQDSPHGTKSFLVHADAVVADPRNDDHAILSQLVAMFAILHNGLVALFHSAARQTQSRWRPPLQDYLSARAVLTLIYRHVIRTDFLRRLLHPEIFRLYDVEAPQFLEGNAPVSGNWSIPLEFSHGAFRVGHALVRPEYRINEGATNDLLENLQKTSMFDPLNMPLNESWVVQWSHFFSIEGSRPNFSRRIGPSYAGGLNSVQIFPAFDDSNRIGLAYRDLMSSALAGLWSLRPLIEELRRRRPGLVRAAPLLDDHQGRRDRLADWLRERRHFGALTDEDIQTLSEDPPLPFFFLWEASVEPGIEGQCMGRLGSVIVAEVIFGALAQFPLPGERWRGDLAEALSRIAVLDGAPDALKSLPSIETMADVVLAAAELSHLRDAQPAFV
jgi:hypothetical protein